MHASANAGRLKVDSIIFECALSKMLYIFSSWDPKTGILKSEYMNRADYFNVDNDAVVFG